MKQKYFWTPQQDELVKKHYDGRSVTIDALASAFNVPRSAVHKRAYNLGVSHPRPKPWTKEEEEYLERNYPRLTIGTLCRNLSRSPSAIRAKRKKIGITKLAEGYSVRSLCEALGVGHPAVKRWMKMGWLKTRDRGIREDRDYHLITDKSIRDFIVSHPEEIDLRRVEKFWFIDILAGGLNIKIKHFAGTPEPHDALVEA